MRLNVLGPPVVLDDEGHEVPVPRGKPGRLLVLLAVRRGQTASTDALMSALWGERPPRSASANLQSYISALRSMLDAATPSGGQRLRFDSGGYQLRLESEECDLFEFEQLLISGRRAARGGDHQRAATTLRRAVRLWQGNPFATSTSSGLAGPALVTGEAQVWDEVWLTAYEDCVEAELAVEPRTSLVPELRRMLVENPVRERLHLLLMEALWAIGDSAAALSTYADARATLVAELGIEPSTPLRDLHTRILRGETLDQVVPVAEPAAPASGVADPQVCRQLPRDIPDFTGRDAVVMSLCAQLTDTDSVSVAALTGPAGAGKTTLAVHIAHQVADRFPDGQLYVGLGGGGGPVREPDQVLAGLLGNLGLPSSAVPAGLEDRAALFRSTLAGRRVLVVLDDVVDAQQVLPLLPGTPGSTVLVTSRNRLVDLATSARVELGAFTSQEGRALLAAVIGADRVDAEPAVADELLALTEGLPLAVRAVSVRLATRPKWSLGSLLARLRQEARSADPGRLLDELAVGDLDVRTGFAMTYMALEEPRDKAAFRRFALAGVSDLPPWAMSALAGSSDFDRTLGRLLDCHLVEPFHAADERYRMHDLLRRYAATECAAVDGDPTADSQARAALRRLFDATRALVGVAYRALPTPADWLPPIGPEPSGPVPLERALVADDPMSWCANEIGLLVAVLTEAAAAGWRHEVLDTVERLGGFLAMRSRLDETERLYSELARFPEPDHLVTAHVQYGLAMAKMMEGRLAEAAVVFGGCAARFDQLGEPVGLAHSLTFLSFCRNYEGRTEDADRLARRAVAVSADIGDTRCRIRALRQLGAVSVTQGRAQDGVRLLEQALELSTGAGVPDVEAMVLSSLAKALAETRELARADEVCRRAADLLDHLAQPAARAYVRLIQGEIAELRGEHRSAIEAAETSLWAFRELGDRRGEASAGFRLAANELRLGFPVRAVPLLRSAVRIFDQLGLRALARQAEDALASATGALLAH
ncbi:AfsR/SARP family transcriptional regulator [Amycolatopsis sp. CA-230715]|uniref:AfsR/SARP family transcriptional regulator n=1 Tax=Amycolatopsis sp. CA-230715 TaxID=2745196 RepID=UPI001C01BB29|nr:AfsR/SARP family transcriptional regulator [Amycolatopsis sp. CA-230715]QWF84128.1 Regulatory protein AfsR [Amycolatopsis sp. CA-230715]